MSEGIIGRRARGFADRQRRGATDAEPSKPTNSKYTILAGLWQACGVTGTDPAARVATLPRACALWVVLCASGCPAQPEPVEAQPVQPQEPEGRPNPEPAAKSDADYEKDYLLAAKRVEGGPLDAAALVEVEPTLREVAGKAKDRHLRANAALLLGSLAEERKDRRTAISFYQQARVLVPEEASPYAVLALALAADGRYPEAIDMQRQLVKLTPDDLQAWLILGELNVKAGRNDAAGEAYASYELRRKGLMDGLTLMREGAYVLSEDDRVGCAAALEPALDTGTALALVGALSTDPSPKVRAEIAGVMGSQRLEGYLETLRTQAGKETDTDAKATMVWAIAEIERSPVPIAKAPSPVAPPPADGEPAADSGHQDSAEGATAPDGAG